MTPFPLPIDSLLGHWNSYIVYTLIGFAFGFVLEMAGFGNSKKLAAQFYFKDLTVLKVMFGAIIVAMLLILSTSALGLLDYNLVWVNPTYLVPGIVGGLVMGVGFIIGGFCPGTSLVAAATAKIDGIFFVLGVFFGIFLFGETVDSYAAFWNSTYLGRFTLMDWLNLDAGVVALVIVLMALFMFWGGEHLERIFGGKPLSTQPRWRVPVAGGLVFVAVGLIVIGQPTTADRWTKLAPTKEPQLTERVYQVAPAELFATYRDRKINTMMLDVRPESDYNQFHILDAQHLPIDEIPNAIDELIAQPANTVFIVMSNDETLATEAWKILVAESVPNVYILEGGINNWIATYAEPDFIEEYALASTVSDEQLAYAFNNAIGARHPVSNPHPDIAIEYTPKIQIQAKRAGSGGGCG